MNLILFFWSILTKKKNFFLGHFFYPDLPVPPNIFVQSFTCCVLVSFLHYFRFQMILVSENISVPFGHSLIFTNPNFVSHLKKELKNENHWKNVQFLVWFYRVILTISWFCFHLDFTWNHIWGFKKCKICHFNAF